MGVMLQQDLAEPPFLPCYGGLAGILHVQMVENCIAAFWLWLQGSRAAAATPCRGRGRWELSYRSWERRIGVISV